MDCRSGAVVGDGFTAAEPAPVVGVAEDEAGRVAGACAAFGAAEVGVEADGSLGEGAGGAMFAAFWIPIGLSSSSSFWALAGLGDAALGDLEDKGLSSSSAGGGLTLRALGEAAVGALDFEERGASSSSVGADAVAGTNLGDVAFLGDVTWSPFMGKDSDSQLEAGQRGDRRQRSVQIQQHACCCRAVPLLWLHDWVQCTGLVNIGLHA